MSEEEFYGDSVADTDAQEKGPEKRKQTREQRAFTSKGSDTDRASARKRKREKEEMERMRILTKRREERTKSERSKREEEEKGKPRRKNRKEEEEKRTREAKKKNEDSDDEEADEYERRITTVQAQLGKIIKAVHKETGGKISVTRGDQTSVREAAQVIQDQVVELMLAQRRMERKIERLERDSMKRNERASARSMSDKNYRGSQRGSEETVSEGWKEVRNERKRRTYAQVSKDENRSGSMNEKVEGRVVVTGKDGWKTPPLTSSAGADAIVVRSSGEKDARRLAEALAKSITVKDIGGAPQAIRVAREGKVIIVPRDGEQGGKLLTKLSEKKELEIRNTKQAEPLLMVSGVSKGMDDQELVEKIERGMGERENGSKCKVVRRVPCRNPWKENVIIRTSLQDFKTMVKRGKVEIDCMMHFVVEYLGLAMCFKCCRFGHVVKY